MSTGPLVELSVRPNCVFNASKNRGRHVVLRREWCLDGIRNDRPLQRQIECPAETCPITDVAIDASGRALESLCDSIHWLAVPHDPYAVTRVADRDEASAAARKRRQLEDRR
jgi:hypothetical protein